MPIIERSALVSYSCEQMFALVDDVESYPEFMPGCVATEVLKRDGEDLEARLFLGRFGVKQSFATRNKLNPPYTMSMSLLEGPFKRLDGLWTFKALGESACKVNFKLDYEFNSGLAALALPKLMEHSASEQVDALCRRAKKVFA